MSFEVGSIIEGKVTGLTKFGAFVDLGEEKTGMVHISEVASTYVKEITDFVNVGQTVKVKVLSIDEAGKISLSMKQAEAGTEAKERGNNFDRRDKGDHAQGGFKRRERSTPNVWNGPKQSQSDNANLSFEEMMSKWKSSSDEKMSDLKRSSDSKRGGGGYGRRGGSHRP